MQGLENVHILISGGCSFVGRHLVDYLFQNTNSELIVCCRNIPENTLFSKRIVYENADLLNSVSYDNIFKRYKPTVVIHLAAITRLVHGEENPELTLKTNYFGTKLIADLCTKHRVKTFLSLSSNLARNPKSVVGITKYFSEIYLRNKGTDKTQFISIRLPNVLGSPGSVTNIFDKQIETGGPITITDKRMERRFVSNEEASILLLTAIEIGKNYNVFVVTKENTLITKLAREMIDRSGKPIKIKFIGIKPGEKLIEEKYHKNEIIKTNIKNLSILKNDWSNENIKEAFRQLKAKNKNKNFDLLIKEIELSLQP